MHVKLLSYFKLSSTAKWLKIVFRKKVSTLAGYIYLGIAIIGELLGTNLLKLSVGFTRLFPTLGTLLAYGFCFYFLSLSIKTVPLNLAYASWAGLGLIFTTIISIFLWREPLNAIGILGLGLIVVGVVLLDGFGTPGH
ncbi:small multidrug resistance protein [Loigolactobacillus rennini DSM 20253]|uniref:Small multidrug resistance protein n=1 Tax=Loigolactobacillus rennini DSM 20253 TaxID=1423796 RepID=A0A0R2D0G4_9LACO|nr:small multidrug resistance protein [Loigolactobacillus rennini DSM 20253]